MMRHSARCDRALRGGWAGPKSRRATSPNVGNSFQRRVFERDKEEKPMKPSTNDQIKGELHELKGNVKETAGQVTNNANLETKGQNEKLAGKVQKKVGQIEKVLEK
jgi:uncharacterized protein YjbJ (UPF0337 family)